jgi:uncharacterized protein YybS (DUF2232 family)
MKFAFGVPAWLGAVKITIILFGIPALVGVLISSALRRRFDLSVGLDLAIFVAAFLFSIVVWLLILATLNRIMTKKK